MSLLSPFQPPQFPSCHPSSPFRPLSSPRPVRFLVQNGFDLKSQSGLSVRVSPTHYSRKKARRCSGLVCYSAAIRPETLQWVCTVTSGLLMLVKGTAIHKSFLVPLVALQAPGSVISWIQSEYGAWAAFLGLLVRLFYFIPGELELPFWTLLLLIVAPHQAMTLRGTQAGAIISLAIAAYLALHHFYRAGSLQKAFDQGSFVATLAIICITLATSLLLF
ncbi:cold-regulated 413 inner membrane protein 1, chloroplastic-like [Aristolochia californica]|uniref:cold-regulated 413 inner membrane protein 1, chloroplastic-like n=1 Tax=Aristolochia californica TaxID=171875 RepID=UPI0035DB92FD